MKRITHRRLLEILSYNQDTGIFRWRIAPCRNIRAGAIAGHLRYDGRRKIRIEGRKYYASILAWFYVNGDWPKDEMDHINGVRSDDRIINLRDVDARTNNENRRAPDKDNRVGWLGVSLKPNGRYLAQIGHKKKTYRLGIFDSPSEAHHAYVKAKRQLHQGCTI